MKAEAEILKSYWGLLNNLNTKIKLDLIEKLSKSIKKDITTKTDSFEKSFGAWESNKSSEEIVNEIRESRTFNRDIESF